MEQPPLELKSLGPFLQRAHELSERDPVMAYWCSFYAAQLGINAKPQAKESKMFLMDLMDKLEAMKASLQSNDAATNDTAGAAYIENFGLKVFVGADNEDRQGKTNKTTAKKFVAAANFLELLKIFGEIDPEIETKIKYAKWKATDIAKALREGRKPTPGPAGGLETDADVASTTASDVLGANVGAATAGMEALSTTEEDDYVRKELAKLTGEADHASVASGPGSDEMGWRSHADLPATPPHGAVSSGMERAGSWTSFASASGDTPGHPGHPGRTPSTSSVTRKAQARLSISGNGPKSPNFSMPLPPQMPAGASSAAPLPAQSAISSPPQPGPSPLDPSPFSKEDPISSTSSPFVLGATAPSAPPIAASGVGHETKGSFLPSAALPGSEALPAPAVPPSSLALPNVGPPQPMTPPPPRPLPIPPPGGSNLHTGPFHPHQLQWQGAQPPIPPPRSPGLQQHSNAQQHGVLGGLGLPGSGIGTTSGDSPSSSRRSSANFAGLQPQQPHAPTTGPGIASAGSSSPTPQHPPTHPGLPSAPPPSATTASVSPSPGSIAGATTGSGPARPTPTSLSPTTVSAIQKHAKWAVSALNYEDFETARAELRKALDFLGG